VSRAAAVLAPPPLPQAAPAAVDALRPALGRLARGLSCAFWGLPFTLLFLARALLIPGLHWADALPLVLGPALIAWGLARAAGYQPQERVWQRAVWPACLLALLMAGLGPFVFLWSRVPLEPYFARAVALLLAAGLAGLVALPHALARLAQMLPDAVLRGDARLFTKVNACLAGALAGLFLLLLVRTWPLPLGEFLLRVRELPVPAAQLVLIVACLAPVATAMALTWKLKELALHLAVAPAR